MTLVLSKICVITDETTQNADTNANTPVLEIRAPTGGTFEIANTKLYVTVVTLSTEDDNKLLEQLKTRFTELLNGINADRYCERGWGVKVGGVGLSLKKFQPKCVNRRAQLSVAAKAVRSTDLLNHNVQT